MNDLNNSVTSLENKVTQLQNQVNNLPDTSGLSSRLDTLESTLNDSSTGLLALLTAAEGELGTLTTSVNDALALETQITTA